MFKVRKHTWKRLVLYGLLVSSYLLLNWLFRHEREYLQIHHWFWALILIPLTMVQHPIASATQAFLLGIFVEGWKSITRNNACIDLACRCRIVGCRKHMGT